MTHVIDTETRKYLNKNFIIRVAEREGESYGKSRLVGAGMIWKHLDDETLIRKMIEKVESSPEQKVVIKYRRGIKFEFQTK